ncbi:hypothetical protein GWI33_010308, partial [Rhynchophorus ferrugineus]
MNKKEFR